MPPSSHCCLHPALCALIHRRAHRWVNVGGAGGSQKPSRHGKWACTCRYCGKRRRDGWARRREGLGWRTPRVRFHSQAPLWRGKEDLNNLLDFPCQIISNKYAVSNEVKRQRQKDVKFVQYLDWDHVWHIRESSLQETNKEKDSLRVGAWVSRNCSSTSWKTGSVAAEREPDDTEPFSSTTSDSPHLCKQMCNRQSLSAKLRKCSYLACFFGFTVDLHTRWKSTVYTHLKLLTKSYTQRLGMRQLQINNIRDWYVQTTDGYCDFESKYKLKNKTLFTHYLEIHTML